MVHYRCNVFGKSRRKGEKNMKKNKVNTKASDMLLPKAYRPLSGWGYFWRAVLFNIPVIGWLCLLITAIAGKSRHGRSYARSYFCGLFLAILVAVIGGAVAFALGLI